MQLKIVEAVAKATQGDNGCKVNISLLLEKYILRSIFLANVWIALGQANASVLVGN